MFETSFNYIVQKLNFNIDDELVLIEKYEITPTEMFVARLILLAQESDEEQQYLAKFLSIPENVRGDFRDILLSLQNKGIILKSCNIPKKGETLDIYELEFNKNFLKNFYRASGDMGEELFEHYPQFANINGNMVGIRNVSKKFVDLEDAWRKYGKIIKWNPDIHNEIINLLDWAVENGIDINKSLANFICDHSWLDLKTLRDGGAGFNTNTVKML